MNGKEYQELAMRTKNNNATERLLNWISNNEIKDPGAIINACFGLPGEVGEFNDMIKKWIFHGGKLDVEHLKKECGDIVWYIALLCYGFDWDLDEIMEMNINKLRTRYPEGFNINRANNRESGDV